MDRCLYVVTIEVQGYMNKSYCLLAFVIIYRGYILIMKIYVFKSFDSFTF